MKFISGTAGISVLLFSRFCFPQQLGHQLQKVPAVDSKTAQTQTIPDHRRLAFQLLESAEAGARSFEPSMRSYLLSQIGRVYLSTDRAKAGALLREAFTATRGIQDDSQSKYPLRFLFQSDILRDLLAISSTGVEELLPQADPVVRKNIAQVIVGRYVEKKQFKPALELITQMAAWDEFPYDAGAQLVAALPAEMTPERLSVFGQAIASYRQHKHGLVDQSQGESLTIMVVRVGRKMPPKLVIQAIDEILRQAKDADEAAAQEGHASGVIVRSKTGDVAFTSYYEVQLFAVLPVLRQLDEGRADSLVRDNEALQVKLSQYPDGMPSIFPPFADPPPQENTGAKITPSSSWSARLQSTPEGQAYMDTALYRKVENILQIAQNDPRQAIALAVTLPTTVPDPARSEINLDLPRLRVLLTIAWANAKSGPEVANQALDELLDELKTAIQDFPPEVEALGLSAAAILYLQMDEKDKAADSVDEGLKAAEKMLQKDTDPNDPDTALKAWWPSTGMYLQLIQVETKISKRSAVKIVKQIKDPQIQATASLVLARALLDLPAQNSKILEIKKDVQRQGSIVSARSFLESLATTE